MGNNEGESSSVKTENGPLSYLLAEGVREVTVLEVVVLRLKSALYQVVRIVNKKSEKLRCPRSQENHLAKAQAISEIFLEFYFEDLVETEIYKAANNRAIEHRRETSAKAHQTFIFIDFLNHFH